MHPINRYSGGGHGATWAGQLASTYGKGIPIVAIAAGGIPVDPLASLTYLDGKQAAGMAFAGIAGLANVYPQMQAYLNSVMKPNGFKDFAKLRDGSICLQKTLLHFLYHKLKNIFTTPNYLTVSTNTLSSELKADKFLFIFVFA